MTDKTNKTNEKIDELYENTKESIDDIHNWMLGIIFVGLILFAIVIAWNFNLTSQIADLPHKYCHNETETKMLGELSFEQIETLNDKYKNILCPSMNINNGKYSCYIQEVKEVCEIK